MEDATTADHLTGVLWAYATTTGREWTEKGRHNSKPKCGYAMLARHYGSFLVRGEYNGSLAATTCAQPLVSSVSGFIILHR